MEQWMGNLELNSELHLPAENRFIGGLIILHFFHSTRNKTKQKKPTVLFPQTNARLQNPIKNVQRFVRLRLT